MTLMLYTCSLFRSEWKIIFFIWGFFMTRVPCHMWETLTYYISRSKNSLKEQHTEALVQMLKSSSDHCSANHLYFLRLIISFFLFFLLFLLWTLFTSTVCFINSIESIKQLILALKFRDFIKLNNEKYFSTLALVKIHISPL